MRPVLSLVAASAAQQAQPARPHGSRPPAATSPAPAPLPKRQSRAAPSCSPSCMAQYQQALELARAEDYAAARRSFWELLNACPKFEKAWVSFVQMERRAAAHSRQRLEAARLVLQRGLTANPGSPALLQAWGLMELQRGNLLAACRMLERSASFEPRNQPVLKWAIVRHARTTVAAGAARGARARAQ